ncbi:T9SS type A sorting domain-containing protein [candidate division WOR-3 bacterium]|nr:T9SS type A sorting domain-containing protein [candidate division WOR-3 bacterium]
MNVLKRIFILFLIFNICLFGKTDGTTGLPLGGIGTGAVKYNAGGGTFTANFRTPTRNGDYQTLSETQFQIFIQRGDSILTDDRLAALQIAGRVDDDAIFPLQRANFGELNDVAVEMTAYMPYYPDSVPMMCHPSAMFEFTIENLESSEVAVALAFQISTPVTPTAIADTGFTANGTSLELCLVGDFPDGTGDLSYGNNVGFFTSGLCDNNLSGTTNRLALRVALASEETRRVRFVLSWYQPDELEHYQYTSYWNNVKEVSVSALGNFDAFKDKSEELVSRMRNSNLPEWLVDQTLNSTVNLVNNSVYFQDGRYCHTEGMWHPEGTMDQMWHARQIYTMINPNLAWQELEWWARTQHVENYTGQIHHDFGTNFNYVEWDDTEHPDYRNIYEWVDLNCGFIISVYEAFIATADLDKLSYFWDPYVKRAGQRILDQVELYGSSGYPFTFESSFSTYDAGGNSQAYNSGLSIAAYQIMNYLAEIMGEADIDSLYEAALDTAVINFESRWLDNTYPVANFCESVLGGPWIANFLKMNPFWDKQKLNGLYNTIVNYYDPLNQGMGLPGGSYSEWQPYLIGHLGGYSLQTNRYNMWWALQKNMYDRNYLNRNLVFNQQLGIPSEVSSPTWIATSSLGTNQYISIPVLWRNYYNIAGYHYNNYSGELWLEPMLFDSLNHELQDVLIITPDGYSTISYNSYGDSYQNQEIVFTPDQSMDVTAIYVWDLYSDSLDAIDFVRVNGVDTDYERTGSGDLAHLKLDWSGTISPAGITIRIEGDPKPGLSVPDTPENLEGYVLNSSQILLSWSAVEGDILGYYLETDIDGVFRTLTATTDTFYLETGLLKSTAYTYRVRSYNARNISDPGTEVVVTTTGGGDGDVINALNAGGDTYLSPVSGIEYIDDETTGWLSGGTPYSGTNAIAGTTDDTLYQSERYGDFGYDIPLTNGSYDVVFKFAEIYWDNPGSRLFDVEMEGERVIRNLDLLFRTDKNTAYDVSMPVELTDGELNIHFTTITNNAKLSALEIREPGTGVDEPELTKIPTNYFLNQNYPNPFNASTRIQYGLKEAAQVRINLYDISGRRVRVLLNERQEAGYYSVNFNADNLAGGIYLYKIEANDFSETRKMILVK